MYHNVLAQTSQGNLIQQQQQSNNQQQPMQSQQYYCYPNNLQGSCSQNQYGQPYQQETYGAGQPQQQIPRSGIGSVGQPISQAGYNIPSIMQNQIHGYGSLPPHILDQIRAYIGTPSPIFILPNNCPAPPSAAPQAAVAAGPPMGQGCPGIGLNCPSAPMYCPPNSCYPYPIAMPVFHPFVPQYQNNSKDSNKNCGCCAKILPTNFGGNVNSNYNTNEPSNEHHCVGGNDDTVCTKRNCPSAINLQALASQLLAIQGIIPCAATRLVLRKVAGSNITSTVEETIERAKVSLNTLTQEQLLAETRHAQQVNALINLHMTANPPPNVVPILTTVQLKVNLLKAHVDSSINRRLSESQGTVANGNLDPVILALKSDQELRDLLGTLRQKECEERVNLNFAPYQSQRVIADSRLNNIQNKISQVESEMERRRGAAAVPRSSLAQQLSDPGWYGYVGDVSNTSSSGGGPARSTQNYESPDPFQFQTRNPKRLHLKPHVGSPETTYERSKKSPTRPSRTRKDSDDDDGEENAKNSGRDPSSGNHCCACEKSSEDDSADEGKKKLGGKIVVARDLDSMIEGERRINSGVSILKLSKNVVIVIDNPCGLIGKNKNSGGIGRAVEEEVKSEVKAEPEKTVEAKTQSIVGNTLNDGDDKIATGTTTEKTKKFKWGWKKDKTQDEKMENKVSAFPEVGDKDEDKIKDDYDVESPVKDIKQENVDYFRKSDGPEPVREQTVQMITKIDYETSVFRAFLNPVAEPPEKERVVEGAGIERSFTEDSLESISTESTVDSGRTTESVSLRVEDSEEASPSPVRGPDYVEHLVGASSIEVSQRAGTVAEERRIETEGSQMNDKISFNFGRIHRSGPSCHNDWTQERTGETDEHEEDASVRAQRSTEDDSISGALTTIGNHVASFGSIIGKIAALKLHKVAEISQTLFPENPSKEPNAIDSSSNKNEAESSVGTREKSISSEAETKKEIVRWKYIKFADIDDAPSRPSSAEDGSIREPYTLPKIKHSIIEDKNRGSKYVLIDEPSEELRRELGEPYRTERSLVIRSRARSPQSSSSEPSEPFTVVKSPERRDKNRVALQLVSRKSSGSRCNNSRDLKSSDKFWFRSRSRDEQPPETIGTNDLTANYSAAETFGSVGNDSVDAEETSVVDSGASVNDERIVKIHEYSKIPVTLNRIKSLDKNEKNDAQNRDTVVSSIA